MSRSLFPLVTLTVLILLPIAGFSQETTKEPLRTRSIVHRPDVNGRLFTRVKLNHPNLGYQHRINPWLSAGIEAGYRFSMTEGKVNVPTRGFFFVPFHWIAMASFRGPGAKTYLSAHLRNGDRISISGLYRNLKADSLVWNDREPSFSSTPEYHEYHQRNSEFGGSVMYHVYFTRLPFIEPFVELGVLFKDIKKDHYMGGREEDPRPANYTENLTWAFPTLRAGIQINWAGW